VTSIRLLIKNIYLRNYKSQEKSSIDFEDYYIGEIYALIKKSGTTDYLR
jgi:hypothetical protein